MVRRAGIHDSGTAIGGVFLFLHILAVVATRMNIVATFWRGISKPVISGAVT